MKDGSFHSPPLDMGFDFVLSSTEHFLCSCPHPRQAECGCRSGFPVRVPLPPSGCRIPGPLNLFAKNFQFPDSGPLLLEGHLQALLFCFSMSGSTGLLSGCLGSFFGLEFFPSIYAFPPPGLMLFPFKRIVRFRGAMLLIVPLNLNSTWILILAFPGGSLSLPVCAS